MDKRTRSYRGNKKRYVAVSTIAFLMIFSAYMVFMAPLPQTTKSGFVLGPMVPFEKSFNKELSNPAKFVGYANPNQKIYVTIGLKWRNEPQLDEALKSMNDPHSPMYQHFYTWEEFKAQYAPPKQIYNALIEWLQEKGLHIKSTTPLRNSVTIYDTIGHIERAFGAKFGVYKGDGVNTRKYYYAPMEPLKLPANLALYVNGIDGITSARIFHTNFWTTSTTDKSAQALYGANAPTYVRGLTGADLEYIYGVNKLFNNSATAAPSTTHIFPTKIRVATVLWEGASSTGSQYAPFDPSNVIGYFQNVTPRWIQQILVNEIGTNVSQIGWYSPSANAVPPGSNVDGNVNVENELDLEMVGTLAPGVNVTLVYSNGTYYASYGTSGPGESDFPDQEYNYILNTLAAKTDRTLVAVSNSWGASGNYSLTAANSVTMADVKALNALGVTIMASSGDGGNRTPSWPAEAALDTYGFLAIGGTTLVPNGVDNSASLPAAVPLTGSNLNKTSPRIGEFVWDGTQCGYTSAYPEPSWQNETIGTGWGGRVTADIAAIANRTIIRTSIQGWFGVTQTWYTYSGGIAGTSVASPVMAGVFADMAAYVGRQYGWKTSGITGFGFFAPTIYHLGYDYYVNGMYASTPPFTDITQVYPYSYPAAPKTGYDMPTGWGVINAWNFIHDIGFRITSVQASVTITQGSYGVFNLKVWYPYGWTCPVGHFKVYGLPTGATGAFNVTYVTPPGWKNNTTAQSNLLLNISTTSTTPTGTYTIYVVGYTYNTTTGQYGNLTYNLTLTVNIISPVPEFGGTTWAFSIISPVLLIGAIMYFRRKRK